MHRGLRLRQREYSLSRTYTTTELDNSGTAHINFQGRTLHHRRPAQLVDMVALDFTAASDLVDLADLLARLDLQDLMARLDLQDLKARLDHHHQDQDHQDLLVGRLEAVAVAVEAEEDHLRVAEDGYLHHRGPQAAQSH